MTVLQLAGVCLVAAIILMFLGTLLPAPKTGAPTYGAVVFSNDKVGGLGLFLLVVSILLAVAHLIVRLTGG